MSNKQVLITCKIFALPPSTDRMTLTLTFQGHSRSKVQNGPSFMVADLQHPTLHCVLALLDHMSRAVLLIVAVPGCGAAVRRLIRPSARSVVQLLNLLSSILSNNLNMLK